MKNWSKFEEKLRKVELLPTWECEAGYDPASEDPQFEHHTGIKMAQVLGSPLYFVFGKIFYDNTYVTLKGTSTFRWDW